MAWNAARVDEHWYVVGDERGMSLVDRATLTSLLKQFFTEGNTPHDPVTPPSMGTDPLG
jgi:hypothetical protein